MKFLIFFLLSTTLFAKPDFRIINSWTNDSCTQAYVTIANKGDGIGAHYYDRYHHWKQFFLIRSSKGEFLLFLDEADPNRRMMHNNGYATINVTSYLNMEKGGHATFMVNYGHAISESKYGTPQYDNVTVSCSQLPDVVTHPLQVTSWYIMPDSNCSVRVNLRNPNEENFSLDAWNKKRKSSARLYTAIAFDGFNQFTQYMESFDPEQKLRLGGGVAGATYTNDNFFRPFNPGDSKVVRVYGRWLGGAYAERTVCDHEKVLHCGTDLRASYQISPQKPKPGDLVRIRFRVRNVGNETSIPTSLAVKWGGETHAKTYSVPALVPNASHIIRRSETIHSAGSYIIKVQIDRTNKNIEYNKDNNDFDFRINVRN